MRYCNSWPDHRFPHRPPAIDLARWRPRPCSASQLLTQCRHQDPGLEHTLSPGVLVFWAIAPSAYAARLSPRRTITGDGRW
jgi:hypothetical protein